MGELTGDAQFGAEIVAADQQHVDSATAAIASVFPIAFGVSSITMVRLAAFNAAAASPILSERSE